MEPPFSTSPNQVVAVLPPPEPVPMAIERTAPPQPAERPQRRWRLKLAVAVVVMATAVIWLARYFNSPAVGVNLSTTQIKSATTVKTPPVTWVGLDGRYLGFNYPDNLSARVTGESGSLESYLFYANDRSGWQLAVAATNDSLRDSSAVRYRQLGSSGYTASNLAVGGLNFLIFTKTTDGWEKTAFAQKGNVLASLALTDPGGADHSDDFDRLIHSFKFK